MQVEAVIDACKDRGIPIRIGVNEGSIIERRDKQVRAQELGRFFSEHRHGQMLALMIAKLEGIWIFSTPRTSTTWPSAAPKVWTPC